MRKRRSPNRRQRELADDHAMKRNKAAQLFEWTGEKVRTLAPDLEEKYDVERKRRLRKDMQEFAERSGYRVNGKDFRLDSDGRAILSENREYDLLFETRDGIGFVTFNRPAQRNAMTFEMYERLAEIADDPGDVRALVISGAGGAFAAGTDMSQFRAFAAPEDAWKYEDDMDKVLNRIERCRVPTIAAITGACTGGGAAIAACCDLRVTDEKLKFGFPIARTLGNCLSIPSLARLSALIGQAKVREVIFTSRLIEADEALACGLVMQITSDPLSRAAVLAAQLAGYAPLTLQVTKEGLRRLRNDGPKANDRDLIETAYMSDDFKEGMEAFLGKRKPAFKGE